MNKPRIYATCKAGCQWETVHKSDFQSRTVTLDTGDWVADTNGYIYGVSVTDLLDEDIVLVDAPYILYFDHGFKATQDGENIVLYCSTLPTSSVDINIAIISAMRAVE